MIEILFFIFGSIAVLSALGIILTKNVLYAACGLVVTFLSIAAIYVLVGAEFLAVTQIMIYVGGIVVLMVFGVMLTNKISGKALVTKTHNKFFGILLGAVVFGALVFVVLKINFPMVTRVASENNIKQIGEGIMTDFIFPFEMAGLLLLMTLIGAATLASFKTNEEK